MRPGKPNYSPVAHLILFAWGVSKGIMVNISSQVGSPGNLCASGWRCPRKTVVCQSDVSFFYKPQQCLLSGSEATHHTHIVTMAASRDGVLCADFSSQIECNEILMSKRERERQRERHRETQRQTERERDRERHRDRERQRER